MDRWVYGWQRPKRVGGGGVARLIFKRPDEHRNFKINSSTTPIDSEVVKSELALHLEYYGGNWVCRDWWVLWNVLCTTNKNTGATYLDVKKKQKLDGEADGQKIRKFWARNRNYKNSDK
jgi:hypothetical protein